MKKRIQLHFPIFLKITTSRNLNFNLILLQLPPPILDDFGRVIADQVQQDNWPARCGIAMALEKISPILPQDQLLPLFHFYVQKGLRDRSADVRSHMRTAALAAINVHGKVCIDGLCKR